MFLGFVLPTVAYLKLKLEKMQDLKVCAPLASALISGLEKRFGHLFSDHFHLLATITHPEFKDMDDDRFEYDVETQVKAKALLVQELEKILPKEDKTDDDLPSTSSCKTNFFPYPTQKQIYALMTSHF